MTYIVTSDVKSVASCYRGSSATIAQAGKESVIFSGPPAEIIALCERVITAVRTEANRSGAAVLMEQGPR